MVGCYNDLRQWCLESFLDDLERSLSRRLIFLTILICVVGLTSACSNRSGGEPPAAQDAQSGALGTRELPTLYPTATPPPSPLPGNTKTPQPTSPPATEVAYDQLVVDVIYSIPILGLERRIRGNVAGEIEVIDEESGSSVTLKNRPGVVVEMQQALPRAAIDDLPAGCDSCVQIEYELPLTDQAGQGWLKDVQLLASLENYTAAIVGPHFPFGTVAGLRREATPFEVAHSAAITSDGELWTWTATEPQVSEPTIVEGLAEQANSDMAQIEWDTLPDSIGHLCYQGGGSESLQLDSPDGLKLIEIRCPELYLPGQLMPVYLTLAEAVGQRLEGSDSSPPELPMSLNTLILYQRADGAALELFADGRLSAIDVEGARYTSTLTSTFVVSLTTMLVDSPLLQAGPSAIFEEDPGNVILMRGNNDIYELAWNEEGSIPVVVEETWNRLLAWVLQEEIKRDDVTPTPAPTVTATAGS